MTTAPHGGSPADTPPPGDGSLPPASPFPQPPSTPSAGAPAAPVAPAVAWPTAPPSGVDPAVAQARQKAGTAMGWGIAGAAAGGLAILLSLVTFGMTVLGGAGAPDGGGYYETIRGTVPGIGTGGGVGGDRLAALLESLESDTGYEADITCPDTETVAASTVVVCHGTVGDYEWTGAVLFEDADGSFALVEL